MKMSRCPQPICIFVDVAYAPSHEAAAYAIRMFPKGLESHAKEFAGIIPYQEDDLDLKLYEQRTIQGALDICLSTYERKSWTSRYINLYSSIPRAKSLPKHFKKSLKQYPPIKFRQLPHSKQQLLWESSEGCIREHLDLPDSQIRFRHSISPNSNSLNTYNSNSAADITNTQSVGDENEKERKGYNPELQS